MNDMLEILEDGIDLLDTLKDHLKDQKKIVCKLEKDQDNKELLTKLKMSMVSLVFGYMALDQLQKAQLEEYSNITGIKLVNYDNDDEK